MVPFLAHPAKCRLLRALKPVGLHLTRTMFVAVGRSDGDLLEVYGQSLSARFGWLHN